VIKAYIITNGVIVTTPESVTASSFGAFAGSPVVSANGTNNAIVWATDPGAYASSGPAVLHAYNATNLANELYNSSQNLASRDNPGGAVKMTAPVVAGGKVYVGAEYALSVYGPAIFLTAPDHFTGGRRVHQFRGIARGRDGGNFHLLHAGRHNADLPIPRFTPVRSI
jgi:hypothetical protein